MARWLAICCAAAWLPAACAPSPHQPVPGAARFAGTYVCTYYAYHRLPHVLPWGALAIAPDGSYVRTYPAMGESRGWIAAIRFDQPGEAILEFTGGMSNYDLQSRDNGSRLHITWKSMRAVDCVKQRVSGARAG